MQNKTQQSNRWGSFVFVAARGILMLLEIAARPLAPSVPVL
jgi:hypothetical protein